MFNDRKRQQSLRQLPAIQKHQTYSGSPKALPTISQIKDAKKSSTKELTQFISKFNNCNSKESLKYSQQLLRSAISVLRGFSQTQNNFQSLFLDLFDVIKRFTFVMDDPEIQALIKQYKVKVGFSFRKTCIMLENQLQNVMKQKNQKFRQLINEYNEFKKEIQIKQGQWTQNKKFLESQIDKYKKLADIQYMKSLEESVQNLKNIKQQLQIQCDNLTKRNDQYLKQIDLKQNIIHEQSYEISKLKSELYDVRIKVDKDQRYFNQMRDRFDGLLVKMIGLKEIIAKVEEQNNILVSERMKMVNRAAVAFQDLTPRPKYHEILGFSKKTQINSTIQIFQAIIQKNKDTKKEIIDKIISKKKNNKLLEAQALRDKVVDDIILAKKQMDNVQKH